MKTLHDIEQHAAELFGDDFEDVGYTGLSVEMSFGDGETYAAFDADGLRHFRTNAILEVPFPKFARFVSLCSQLDAWIKGDAK